MNPSKIEPRFRGIPLSCWLETIQLITSDSKKVDQLIEIAGNYKKAGYSDQALKTLSQAHKLANTLEADFLSKL